MNNFCNADLKQTNKSFWNIIAIQKKKGGGEGGTKPKPPSFPHNWNLGIFEIVIPQHQEINWEKYIFMQPVSINPKQHKY